MSIRQRVGVLILLLGIWIDYASATSNANSVTEIAQGFGATPQEATSDGLVNAARQAIGVALEVNPDFRQQTMDWVIQQNYNGNVITQRWNNLPQPRLPTLAGIQSYRVLSLKQTADNRLWQAEVEARIAKNRALRPQRGALFSLVILPFTTRAASYELHQPVSAIEISERLRNALVESFTLSDQVRVLDRIEQQARVAEQMQSMGSLDATERAKLGHQLGADLLLAGQIDRFQLGYSGASYYGSENTSLMLNIYLHYRLIDATTGDILLADILNYNPPANRLIFALRQQMGVGISMLGDPERLSEMIYPDVARAIANPVLNQVFPLQVLKIDGADSIFVSQGKGRLTIGDTLIAVNTSQLKDPQTHTNINAQQATDLRLNVTQVAPGYAITQLSQGEINAIKLGMELVVIQPTMMGAFNFPTRPMTPGSSEAPINWD